MTYRGDQGFMGKDKGSSGHEFTAEQNKVITDLSQAMLIVAIGFFVGAVGSLLNYNVNLIGAIIGALVNGMVGKTLLDSRQSMQAVVNTQGDDIGHLMTAMDKLASLFKVYGILMLVLAFFAGLGILAIIAAVAALS
jgi:small-conductance mechanosensitive channel